ncbi:MAG: zinc ribbon domain-containing protein [Phycisphaerae bacterium]|nr:zinc ribbon domain-containing protein [Phycisphaerae bacterium]
MLRFTLIPCVFVVMLPVIVMIFLRLVAAVFRLADRGARYGQGGLPRGRGRGGRRGGRNGWGPYAMNQEEPPPPIDAEPVCPNPQCRHPNRSGARYCGRCGTRLTF